MADPFSIITGTIGAVDVCYRFGRYLHELQAEAAHFEDEIAKLIRVIDALDSINRSLRTRYEDFTESYSAENPAPKEVAKLWRDINSNLEDCCIIVKDLEDLVKAVVGKQIQDGGPKWKRKLGDFRKQLRKQSKESQFERLSERIHTYHTALQLMLDLVILCADMNLLSVSYLTPRQKRDSPKSFCSYRVIRRIRGNHRQIFARDKK